MGPNTLVLLERSQRGGSGGTAVQGHSTMALLGKADQSGIQGLNQDTDTGSKPLSSGSSVGDG